MSQKNQKTDIPSEKKEKKFRLYKFLTIAVLVAFLLGGALLFENDITVENLRYLIKYFDFSSSGAFSEESVIYYNADSGNEFYVFRGDLALVNPGGITLFDRRGSAVMTDTFNMANPTCVSSDKYIAVYDLGGHQVRVYNSFALLYENTFDYTVRGVSINSDGEFAVVTAAKSYRSAVYVYDREFKEVYKWLSSDKYATDAVFSDRNILTVSTVHSSEGELLSELIELKPGNNKPVSEVKMKSELPLSHFTDRNGTVLLTDENLKFIKKGKEIASVPFQEGSVKKFSLGEEYSAVLQDDLSVGVNFRLGIYDREGKEIISQQFSVAVLDIEIYEDAVYVLTHTELYIIKNGEETKKIPVEGEFSDLGVLSRDCLILCGQTEAHIKLLDS